MTLSELVNAIGSSDSEKIQICRPNNSRNCFDEVNTGSPLLIPLGGSKIKELEAISKGVIRVSIDWKGIYPEIDWDGIYPEEEVAND